MEQQSVMTSQDIDRSLDRISLEIIERHHGVEDLSLVGIHTGGVFLAQRLHKKVLQHQGVSLPIGVLDITLYRDDWSLIAQNPIVRRSDIGFILEARKVVLVDDVVFTGRTVRAAMDALMDYGRPQSIQLAVLVDRGGRELPIQPDYVGMAMSVTGGVRVDVLLRECSEYDGVVLTTV
ncbi:MAG: bifunctional pyr operon transcriptional regulator/uracil phosphoribosyltransferase [Desulfobulbus propionicus]|nr:MAG: bifunctional pyr operon transcriptional regulator/uracil phosphoribosyltransferase [Desulfobulbus propionicus]